MNSRTRELAMLRAALASAASCRALLLSGTTWLRMTVLSLLLIAGLCLTSATPALARGFLLFGVNEYLHTIAKTGVTGPDGDTLALGYKVSMYGFGGSWWIHDDGYVLMDMPNFEEYYPLSQAEIAAYQRAGALPNPLPRYTLSLLDYVLGFSSWILVVGALVWFGGRYLWRRLRSRFNDAQ